MYKYGDTDLYTKLTPDSRIKLFGDNYLEKVKKRTQSISREVIVAVENQSKGE